MIKNNRQYKITKTQFLKFSSTLKQLKSQQDDASSPGLLALQKSAVKSQMVDLQREIEEYEDLISGNIPITELQSIDELPNTLIRARISLKISQKELGEMVGMPEQQIQRYESTEYESTSISKIRKIANVLNLKIEEQVKIPPDNFSLKKFFKKMDSVGIDSKFIMNRLLPPTLAARFLDKDTAPDLLGLQAAYHIGKIFEIKPEEIFESTPLVLNTSLLDKVKYKIPASANKKKLDAYTIYAHYIACLISKATRQEPIKKIPDKPSVIRNDIITKYGEITFDTLLQYVWSLGISVAMLDPTSFHAACFRDDDGKSTIILTQKTDSEACWMFNLLHEYYHVLQGTDKVTKSIELCYSDDVEEQNANQFAYGVLLGKDPQKLTKKSLQDANWDMPQIKRNIQKLAKTKNIRADVLANYIAFRLSEEQGKNVWEISTLLQKPLTDARQIICNQLIKNIDFNTLVESDLNLLLPILSESEVLING